MAIPKWLKQRIGTPTRGRGCKATKCAFGCRQDVLAGPDEDQMAVAAIVDPIPLSALGEALARMSGRPTYTLGRHNEGLALWLRNALDIANHPASDEVIVVAAHKCHTPELPSVEIQSGPAKTKGLAYDNEPPF